MYRGIIILVVLFILLTVLYQHKIEFRKVICYNSIITLPFFISFKDRFDFSIIIMSALLSAIAV